MKAEPLTIGDVVQIDPDHDPTFAGCFMLVTEPKSFGAMGFVQVPGKGRAYYRCGFEHMELVGHATWVPSEETEAGDGS